MENVTLCDAHGFVWPMASEPHEIVSAQNLNVFGALYSVFASLIANLG